MHVTNTDLINKYLYNGKELQDQTNYYSYGFRDYDPQLGRWHVVDAMAEAYMSHSPYHFAGNNPISNREINGMEYLLDPDYGAGEGDVSIGGGAQWVNYRGPTSFYGDNSGNYSVGGSGMYSAGPTGNDWDYWNDNGAEEGNNGASFSQWYQAVHNASWMLGYTSVQGALLDGYTFSNVKWRREVDVSSDRHVSSDYIIDGDDLVMETIAIDVAYVDTNMRGVIARENTFGGPDRNNMGGAGGISHAGKEYDFSRPKGGVVFRWNGFNGNDSRVSRGTPEETDISTLMSIIGLKQNSINPSLGISFIPKALDGLIDFTSGMNGLTIPLWEVIDTQYGIDYDSIQTLQYRDSIINAMFIRNLIRNGRIIEDTIIYY